MPRLRVALVVPLLLLPACSAEETPADASAKVVPTPSPSPSIVVNPPGVVIANDASGRSLKRVRRAMRDLKAVNLWLPLTKHLYKIKFRSQPGAASVPDDGHLADAILTVAIDKRAQGLLCDVMFFPSAIAAEVERWQLYYQHGALTGPPPTLRQMWGAVTAHELAHCLRGAPGEKVALEWERKALAALRELSL